MATLALEAKKRGRALCICLSLNSIVVGLGNCFLFCVEACDMFTNAVQAVQKDEGFYIDSLHARTALNTASLLQEWCRDDSNLKKLGIFALILVV